MGPFFEEKKPRSALHRHRCPSEAPFSRRRIPLLASPRGGVAERSKKHRAASDLARTGWCSDRWDNEHHPGCVNKGARRHFSANLVGCSPRGGQMRENNFAKHHHAHPGRFALEVIKALIWRSTQREGCEISGPSLTMMAVGEYCTAPRRQVIEDSPKWRDGNRRNSSLVAIAAARRTKDAPTQT